MIEFSVFVNEIKKATVFAGSALEAIEIYSSRVGSSRGVWAMQAKVI